MNGHPSTKTQLEAARRSVLAMPRADLATLLITGKDRIGWLNGLLTCDLMKVVPGQAVYGLAVGRNGRVLADVMVVADPAAARVIMAIPAAVAPALRSHLDHYLVMEDVEMQSQTERFEPWMIHGPQSADALDAARAVGAIGGVVDLTGLGGAFLFVPLLPSAGADAVRAAIARFAAGEGGLVGDEAGWEVLRLERAVPRFGTDFDDKTYPQEASLEKTAVSFEKGCYLGQEVVCMLEMRGHVKRKLVSLVVDAANPPAPGADVIGESGTSLADGSGAVVRSVTSAARSPALGKTVALAMMKRAYSGLGTRVVVGGSRAEVVELPA